MHSLSLSHGAAWLDAYMTHNVLANPDTEQLLILELSHCYRDPVNGSEAGVHIKVCQLTCSDTAS